MIYLDNFIFAGEDKENKFLYPKDLTPEEVSAEMYRDFSIRSFYDSTYPFDILTRHHLNRIDCSEITILYGGNGSGKTTALNIIAEKLSLNREAPFNKGEFYGKYLNLCRYNYNTYYELKIPEDSQIIVSDDVFEYILKCRDHNDHRLDKKLALMENWENLKYKQLSLFDDIEQLKDRRMSESKYVSKYLKEEEQRELSNGERGFQYFISKIEKPCLYLLDEPENSLSLERQMELADYIMSSARFFESQFIIATHSPVFLSMKGAKIYDFDADPVDIKPWTELTGMREWFDFFMKHREEFEAGRE